MSTVNVIIYASDTHGQVHVHAGMAYKFNRDMHACFGRNYPEARFRQNTVDGAPKAGFTSSIYIYIRT